MNTLSRVRFGCGRVTIGLTSRVAARLLESARNKGITHFDTAPAYPGSEALLGVVFGGDHEIRITTKVGMEAVDSTRDTRALDGMRRFVSPVVRGLWPRGGSRVDYSNDSFGKFDLTMLDISVNRSLMRMRREYIDELLLHEPRVGRVPPSYISNLEILKNSRRVRAYGVGTGSHVEQVPIIGSVIQCSIMGYRDRGAHSVETIAFHGLARTLDERVLHILESKFAATGCLSDVVREAGVGVLCGYAMAVLLSDERHRIIYSTLLERRITSLVSELLRFEEASCGYQQVALQAESRILMEEICTLGFA